MTQTMYEAAITRIIQDAFGPDFEFPEDADTQMGVCFLQRLTVEEAAESLMKEWGES